MIFDTHIHLNDEKLYENLDLYLKEAKEVGVSDFLCVGYDLESSKRAIEIANKYNNVYAAIGLLIIAPSITSPLTTYRHNATIN